MNHILLLYTCSFFESKARVLLYLVFDHTEHCTACGLMNITVEADGDGEGGRRRYRGDVALNEREDDVTKASCREYEDIRIRCAYFTYKLA